MLMTRLYEDRIRQLIAEMEGEVHALERRPLDDVDFHGRVPTLKRCIEKLKEVVDGDSDET